MQFDMLCNETTFRKLNRRIQKRNKRINVLVFVKNPIIEQRRNCHLTNTQHLTYEPFLPCADAYCNRMDLMAIGQRQCPLIRVIGFRHIKHRTHRRRRITFKFLLNLLALIFPIRNELIPRPIAIFQTLKMHNHDADLNHAFAFTTGYL